MSRFEEYERFYEKMDKYNLEELLGKLIIQCRRYGYSFELMYSEVEDLWFGIVTDVLQMPSLIHEAKRHSSMKSCVIKLYGEVLLDE